MERCSAQCFRRLSCNRRCRLADIRRQMIRWPARCWGLCRRECRCSMWCTKPAWPSCRNCSARQPSLEPTNFRSKPARRSKRSKCNSNRLARRSRTTRLAESSHLTQPANCFGSNRNKRNSTCCCRRRCRCSCFRYKRCRQPEPNCSEPRCSASRSRCRYTSCRCCCCRHTSWRRTRNLWPERPKRRWWAMRCHSRCLVFANKRCGPCCSVNFHSSSRRSWSQHNSRAARRSSKCRPPEPPPRCSRSKDIRCSDMRSKTVRYKQSARRRSSSRDSTNCSRRSRAELCLRPASSPDCCKYRRSIPTFAVPPDKLTIGSDNLPTDSSTERRPMDIRLPGN